jgi:phage-related protein
MDAVAPGVRELRLHVLGEWRVVYVAALADAVYVLHCFRKRARKTPQAELELARRRYRQIGDR